MNAPQGAGGSAEGVVYLDELRGEIVPGEFVTAIGSREEAAVIMNLLQFYDDCIYKLWFLELHDLGLFRE